MRYHFRSFFYNENFKKEFFCRIKENKFLYNNLKNHEDDETDLLIYYIMERKNLKNSCYIIARKIALELQICNAELAKKNLYIVDVPSHEMVIYQLAIEQAIEQKFTLAFENFENIFIMTDNYDFIALTKKKNAYELSRSNNYVGEYKFTIQWLRYHDSLLFWNCLFKEQQETGIIYYLNANIHWGDTDINQYLNFENVLQNNILEQILETSLLRLQGIYNDKKVVFEATDTIVKSLVEKTNIKASSNDSQFVKIKVNSVYLTGLTSSNHSMNKEDKVINDRETLINIFAHPMRKKSSNENNSQLNSGNIKAACLILWPNYGWAQKFVPFKNEEYYRVGETHIVSPDKNLKVIHRNDDNNYQCDLDDTYIMFQTQYPKVVRVGHYNYKGNHELINVNFNNIFDENSSIGSKVFNYILCNVFASLVDNANYKNMINECNIDYREILHGFMKECNYILEKNTSFIVYPSHYYTDKVIGKIKSIIPKTLGNRIISIKQMNHGNNISVISPDSIIRLKTIVQSLDAQNGDVVFFDTIISSGRTRDVIKNYITSDDFKKTFKLNEWKNIIIIDAYKRAYLDIVSHTNNFYLRMDVPRLGNDSTCVLCKALAIADEICHKTKSSVTSNIIRNWINTWKTRSVLDLSQKEYSTENRVTKSPNCFDFNPPIINSIGLLIYAIEVHMLYARDNIILDIINEYKNELLPQDIVLLICSKLLLFGEYSSTTLQSYVIEELLKALMNIKTADQYSFLGFLTLLIQNHQIVAETMQNIADDYMKNDMHMDNLCVDIKVLFSYYASLSKSLYLILPHNVIGYFDYSDRMDAYQFIHSIVCNDCGHFHDTELMKYMKKSIASPAELFNALKTICSILDAAIDKMQYIEQCEINSICIIKSRDDLYAEIKELQEKIILLEKNSSGKSLDDIWHSPEHLAIFKKVSRTNEYYENIHKGLYISGDDNSVYNEIKNIIVEITNSQEEPFLCKLEKNIYNKPNINQKIWYFWNKEIKSEVKYLLENIRNNANAIDEDKNFGSISIKRDSLQLEIIITNFSEENAKDIEKKTIEKRRRNMVKNKTLGVEISYSSQKEGDVYRLNTIIKIPSLSSSLK